MKSFEIAIQVGAILAVVLVYWRSFLVDHQTLKRVLAAFIPTAIVGYLLYHLIKKYLFSGSMIALCSLFIGGIVLILFDRWYRDEKATVRQTSAIPFSKAAGIGLAQCLAVVPGVSRSAATIVGGLCFGLDRKTAVEFSFLLAVPTLCAATALDLVRSSHSFSVEEWKLLLIGAIVAFAVAYLSIRLFVEYVQRNIFTFFGIYRIAIAIIFGVLIK